VKLFLFWQGGLLIIISFDQTPISYFQVIMNFVYLAIGAGLASTLRKWISYSKSYHIRKEVLFHYSFYLKNFPKNQFFLNKKLETNLSQFSSLIFC
jgi:hypothetical protein